MERALGGPGDQALISSLRRGLTTQVRLRLSTGAHLGELQAAIEANTTLRKVELIFSHHALSQRATRRQEDELNRFIASICRRPSLQYLTLTSAEGELSHYALPTAVLTAIIDLAIGLEKLELGLIELVGEVDDFTSLEESMRNQSSLREISCTCWLSEETRMRLSLDSLVMALAASRSLQAISFQPAFTFGGGLTNVTTGSLCTMPTLRKLKIAKCNLSDENVVAIAEVLTENAYLTELHLSCRLEEPGSHAIANCLRGTEAKLEVLVIHNTATNIDSDSTESSAGDILRNDSSTSSSETVDHKEIDDGYYAEIAQALQVNGTLKHFALHGTKLSLTMQTSFLEMLKHNYTLESISLLDLGGDLKDEMEMYTLLNRCGRARLFEAGGGNGRPQWVDTMALVANDIDCLFYLLSTKPSLCDLDDDTNTDLDANKGSQGDSPSSDDQHQPKESSTKRLKTS